MILHANQTGGDGNYWIRTTHAPGCGTISQQNETTGILRYNAHSTALPTTARNPDIPMMCQDEPYASLVPVVPWQVGAHPANNVSNDTFEAGISKLPFHQFKRWDLTDTPLWYVDHCAPSSTFWCLIVHEMPALNFFNPSILNLDNTTFDPAYAIVEYDYDDKWGQFPYGLLLYDLRLTSSSLPCRHRSTAG